MRKLSFLVIIGLTGSFHALHAQEDWKKRFPDAEAVYTQLNCDITIKKSGNKYIATSAYSEDLLYLTDNSVKMLSKGRIYHSGFNELKKWEAYTQVGNSKKIKVLNVATGSSRSNNIFYDDVKSTSFDFAGAQTGANRHLEYEIVHNDIFLLSPHYFERYFPVANGTLTITYPSEVKLKYLIKGLNAEKVKSTETKKRGNTILTFQIYDLSGQQPYEDAPDNAYYATHLIYYIEQIQDGSSAQNILSNPDDLYKHSYEYIRRVNSTISAELKSITDSLIRDKSSVRAKAGSIYKWVQDHIKYVAFEDGMEGFVPREATLVCSRRFGDCKDMASILTAMLNYAGVPAYFTWIGTREIPYDYTEVPLPIVDNHMICAVRADSEFIFLDGTDESCIFGRPPAGIQGKQAMIAISEKEYQIVRVPVISADKNRISDSTFLELTDAGLTGKLRISLTGYYASGIKTLLSYTNDKEREDYLKSRFSRGSNKIRFSNWKVSLEPDYNQATITADLDLPGYVRKLGDELFVNLNLFKVYEHQEIDFPKRTMPIEFQFLEQTSYVTALKIPEGSKITYTPESESFKNDVWGFSMNYQVNKGMIYLSQQFTTNQLMLYPAKFEQWNKVLEHLFPHYKQTVALSKK
jgi:hypothetical protein